MLAVAERVNALQAAGQSGRRLRVAWLGTPMDRGSVTYIATQLLERLPELGVEVDCFSPSVEELVPSRLRQREGLRFYFQSPRYRPGRWYSRGRLSGYLIGQSDRALAQALLAERIRRQHALRRYDCVYQISQLELFALRAVRRALPAIVLHPHTYAAAELRWLERERHLVADAAARPQERMGRAMIRTRAAIQRRDARLASLLIAPSARFAELLACDYGLPRERIAVVPNPIDLLRYTPAVDRRREAQDPQRLLFISRIAVRKGVEMVVRLSHQLADLRGRVHIDVIGDRPAWGDYSSLLAGLNPATATYQGYVQPPALSELYRRADMVLVPSHFEPFGLTVSEALASGVPVIASSEVGASEGVDRRVCRVFAAGDQRGFCDQVRALLAETALPERGRELSLIARAEAERLFSAHRCASILADALWRLRRAADQPESGRI